MSLRIGAMDPYIQIRLCLDSRHHDALQTVFGSVRRCSAIFGWRHTFAWRIVVHLWITMHPLDLKYLMRGPAGWPSAKRPPKQDQWTTHGCCQRSRRSARPPRRRHARSLRNLGG